MTRSQLLYAGYGMYNRTFDVTEKVWQSYQAGQRRFKATNDAFGDPARGFDKVLFVLFADHRGLQRGWIARENDEETLVVLPDNLTLGDRFLPRVARPSYLVHCSWGLGGSVNNETPTAINDIGRGTQRMTAVWSFFSSDPAPRRNKFLVLLCSEDQPEARYRRTPEMQVIPEVKDHTPEKYRYVYNDWRVWWDKVWR